MTGELLLKYALLQVPATKYQIHPPQSASGKVTGEKPPNQNKQKHHQKYPSRAGSGTAWAKLYMSRHPAGADLQEYHILLLILRLCCQLLKKRWQVRGVTSHPGLIWTHGHGGKKGREQFSPRLAQ